MPHLRLGPARQPAAPMKTTVICLCPVRNEAWILRRFLDAAALWADHILIADQGSTDGSREIVARHPKARLIDNPGTDLEESSRQALLVEEARKIPGKRLLLALDADEFLTGNFTTSPEWRSMLELPPGHGVFMERADLYPFHQYAAVFHAPWLFGVMDDGRPHQGRAIHSPRVPLAPLAPRLHLSEIKVMHYQYTDWTRMKSKHMRYQVEETLLTPERGAISIYRQYHHMDPPNPWRGPVPKDWFDDYRRAGLDMTSATVDGHYGTDLDVLRRMEEHGAQRFSRLAIWDRDWVSIARARGLTAPERFADPRTALEKRAHAWLARSQDPSVMFTLPNRLISLFLRRALKGW